jgi:hypothetical protein
VLLYIRIVIRSSGYVLVLAIRNSFCGASWTHPEYLKSWVPLGLVMCAKTALEMPISHIPSRSKEHSTVVDCLQLLSPSVSLLPRAQMHGGYAVSVLYENTAFVLNGEEAGDSFADFKGRCYQGQCHSVVGVTYLL